MIYLMWSATSIGALLAGVMFYALCKVSAAADTATGYKEKSINGKYCK